MALMASPIGERKRVKVYELRENDWFDRGTGFCAVHSINEDGRISVEAEDEPDRSLLEVRVKKDDNFQKQQDTLIVWTDSHGVDMALSFQEAEGCGVVWSTIMDLQQRLPDGIDDEPTVPLILPDPQLGNLPEIEQVVRSASNTQHGRDSLCRLIMSENYITKLTPLVEMAEDFEDLPDLHRLCNIMKTLILFNETPIIEHIVKDDIILGVVGALEYDPDFPNHKANHRQYLSDESRFKEVVRIEEEDIRKKIHFTYRLQYLKDVVLARILDDPTFNVLNSLIYFHQIEIVQHVATNGALLAELFSVAESPDSTAQKKKDAILFLQQCCSIAKNLQAASRASLYQNLISAGLLSTISLALQIQDASVRVAGIDILVSIIEHDALMMRNYIYKPSNEKTKPMTDTLIEIFLCEEDQGVKAQIADAIRILLEPNINGLGPERPLIGDMAAKLRNNTNQSQTDQFLQSFFDSSAKKLFQPLKDLENRQSMNGLSIHEVTLYTHLVEILCFFLRQHPLKSKYLIIFESLTFRVAQLMTCPEKHLKLTAIKYFRTLIGLQDEFHNRQLFNNNLLEPLLSLTHTTMPRNSLLNSACLELFEYVRRENIKPVIIHLNEQHRSKLETLATLDSAVDVFDLLVLRFDQLNSESRFDANNGANGDTDDKPDDSSFMTSDADTPGTRRITINGGHGGLRWHGLKDPDPDEDAYFNASDDDDDEDVDELARGHAAGPLFGAAAAGIVPHKPLVDYDDDDADADEDMLEEHGRELASHPHPRLHELDPDPDDSTLTTPTLEGSPLPRDGPEPQPQLQPHPHALDRPAVLLSGTPPTMSEKRKRAALGDDDDDDGDELARLSALGARAGPGSPAVNKRRASDASSITLGRSPRDIHVNGVESAGPASGSDDRLERTPEDESTRADAEHGADKDTTPDDDGDEQAAERDPLFAGTSGPRGKRAAAAAAAQAPKKISINLSSLRRETSAGSTGSTASAESVESAASSAESADDGSAESGG